MELETQEAMTDQGALEAMVELETQEAMADQGALEAMVELETREAMAEQETWPLFFQVAKVGQGALWPWLWAWPPRQRIYGPPKKNSWGSSPLVGALEERAHEGALEEQALEVVLGSRTEPAGALGSRTEPAGALGSWTEPAGVPESWTEPAEAQVG